MSTTDRDPQGWPAPHPADDRDRVRDTGDRDRVGNTGDRDRVGNTGDRDRVANTGDRALVANADGLLRQWDAIQATFVDEPRRAVEDADALVEQTISEVTRTFSEARSSLEQQWAGGHDVSTEDLRLALQQYRSFFHRLLGT
jgi:hypothetical protein